MTADGFEATFRLRVDRDTAWRRLTEHPTSADDVTHLWLPGFDGQVTVTDAEPPDRLRATKSDEPCAGTDIVVTVEDHDTGTQVHVIQSRFGEWLSTRYDMMSVGWRFIIADLHTYLATGANARRHLRPWGDLGANPTVTDGGIRVEQIRPNGLATQAGLAEGDLLVALAGAPVASLDDLVTILRVHDPTTRPTAEWIRAGSLMTTPTDPTI